MNLRQAKGAIAGILEALDDKALPKPGKVEQADGKTIAWFGSTGYCLGSAVNGFGERIPKHYRERAISDALIGEALYRLDRAHLTDEEAAS